MNAISKITLMALLTVSTVHAEEIDFIKIIKADRGAAAASGINKLNASEQEFINSLFNRVYQSGMKAAQEPQAPPQQQQGAAARALPGQMLAYVTKIDENDGDVLKLDNGAIVEITYGFLGFVGFNKAAVLYSLNGVWKIWISGKREFSCDLIKEPAVRPTGRAERISITEVLARGAVLKSLDGTVYEVSDLDRINTGLWLAPFDAFLIEGSNLINLNATGGDMIGVTISR